VPIRHEETRSKKAKNSHQPRAIVRERLRTELEQMKQEANETFAADWGEPIRDNIEPVTPRKYDGHPLDRPVVYLDYSHDEKLGDDHTGRERDRNEILDDIIQKVLNHRSGFTLPTRLRWFHQENEEERQMPEMIRAYLTSCIRFLRHRDDRWGFVECDCPDWISGMIIAHATYLESSTYVTKLFEEIGKMRRQQFYASERLAEGKAVEP
jgi:hypothetical protein